MFYLTKIQKKGLLRFFLKGRKHYLFFIYKFLKALILIEVIHNLYPELVFCIFFVSLVCKLLSEHLYRRYD